MMRVLCIYHWSGGGRICALGLGRVHLNWLVATHVHRVHRIRGCHIHRIGSCHIHGIGIHSIGRRIDGIGVRHNSVGNQRVEGGSNGLRHHVKGAGDRLGNVVLPVPLLDASLDLRRPLLHLDLTTANRTHLGRVEEIVRFGDHVAHHLSARLCDFILFVQCLRLLIIRLHRPHFSPNVGKGLTNRGQTIRRGPRRFVWDGDRSIHIIYTACCTALSRHLLLNGVCLFHIHVHCAGRLQLLVGTHSSHDGGDRVNDRLVATAHSAIHLPLLQSAFSVASHALHSRRVNRSFNINRIAHSFLAFSFFQTRSQRISFFDSFFPALGSTGSVRIQREKPLLLRALIINDH